MTPIQFFLWQLLGGSRVSGNDLKEFAARQQQQIAVKERELKAKQIQLMEMKRKSPKKPLNPYVKQLTAKADEQGERLTALRHVQDQVDSYKLSNSALGMLNIPYLIIDQVVLTIPQKDLSSNAGTLLLKLRNNKISYNY